MSVSRPRNFWKKSSIRGSPAVIAFGVLVVASQAGLPLLFGLNSLGVIRLPPVNDFTELSNAAMEMGVADGTVPLGLATLWAQGFGLDLTFQFY